MKLPPYLMAASALALFVTSAVAQEPIDYKTAYERADKGDKPLLVLVTAEWCPPCQQMKKSTIPELLKKKTFKDFHWAAVDYDRENKLAKQLIGDRGVPQLIMYEKRDGKWVRRYLRGYKQPKVVEAFVAQARTIRTASTVNQGVEKK